MSACGNGDGNGDDGDAAGPDVPVDVVDVVEEDLSDALPDVPPDPVDEDVRDVPTDEPGDVSHDEEGEDGGGEAGTCPEPLPESWIFCDDFEEGSVAERYFEFGDNDGDFRRVDTEANSGDYCMEVHWQEGEVGAGGFKVTFGRNPIGTQYRTDEDFNEIYWRMYVKHQPDWQGSPGKLSRATSFWRSDWSQAMIAHLWSSGDVLLGDPVRCVSGGTPVCEGYNDFSNMSWLGQMPGETPIFSTSDAGRWRCIEGHVILNTPGESDGVFEFWIDGNLENRRDDFNWRGSWSEYGINAVFFENYWNDGSVADQRRWFDDVVIATERIGCD